MKAEKIMNYIAMAMIAYPILCYLDIVIHNLSAAPVYAAWNFIPKLF